MPLFIGEPEGVAEGEIFSNRRALIDANLHRSTMHGIDGNGNEGVAAIVLSGGYEDDRDYGDEIIYTGHGGNDPVTGRQIADQSWDSSGNKGLVVSELRQIPVRVIRGFKHNSKFSPAHGYKYDGLFKVIDHWEENGQGGFKICRFKLVKESTFLEKHLDEVKEGALVKVEPFGKDPKWFAMGVEGPESMRVQQISATGNLGLAFLGKTVGDLVNFGGGFKILEIKRYLSK